MQVVCKDGTTIQCQDFEAVDSGVLLFQEETRRREGRSEDEEEEEEERRAAGFVPITELRFVLPDEMLQRGAAGQGGRTADRGRGGGTPPGAPTSASGQIAQQQQIQQQPGAPGQQPFDAGGQ